MNKIILLAPIVLSLLASCGTSTVSSPSSPLASSIEPEIVVSTLDEMCNYLEEKKVVEGTRKTMSASYIGAIDGTKYEDTGVEMYLYQEDAPETFTVLGIEMKFNATNGKFALVFSSGVEEDDNIVRCFKAVKTK